MRKHQEAFTFISYLPGCQLPTYEIFHQLGVDGVLGLLYLAAKVFRSASPGQSGNRQECQSKRAGNPNGAGNDGDWLPRMADGFAYLCYRGKM